MSEKILLQILGILGKIETHLKKIETELLDKSEKIKIKRKESNGLEDYPSWSEIKKEREIKK